jgi:hypothetical protein
MLNRARLGASLESAVGKPLVWVLQGSHLAIVDPCDDMDPVSGIEATQCPRQNG